MSMGDSKGQRFLLQVKLDKVGLQHAALELDGGNFDDQSLQF